jgi:hypothetical protein
MKMNPTLQTGHGQRRCSGYTLVEMLFSAGIYMFILVGVVVCIQIYALRVYTLGATKLTATQGALKALNQIRADIQQGKLIQVGTADNSGNFTPYSGSALAVGNALQIFQTANQTNPYSIYYLQTNTVGGISSNNLIWISASASGAITTTALTCFITNSDIFEAEDWDNWLTTGMQIVTNSIVNNQIYSVKLQLYQWEYPIAVVNGAGLNSYDFYQIRTRVCRRATD